MSATPDALGTAPGADPSSQADPSVGDAGAAAAAGVTTDQGAPAGVTPPAVAQLTDQQIAEIADPTMRAQATSLKAGWDRAMRDLADQRKGLDSDEAVKYVRDLRKLAGTDPGEVARRLRAEADYFDRPGTGAAPAGRPADAAGGTAAGNAAAIDAQLEALGLPKREDMTDTERVLVQMVTGMAGTVSELRGGQVNAQIDGQIARLRQTHGAAFDKGAEQLVLQTAAKYGLNDLDAAYRIANFDSQKDAGTAAAYAALKAKGLNYEPPTVAGPTSATEPTTVAEIVEQEANKLGIA